MWRCFIKLNVHVLYLKHCTSGKTLQRTLTQVSKDMFAKDFHFNITFVELNMKITYMSIHSENIIQMLHFL